MSLIAFKMDRAVVPLVYRQRSKNFFSRTNQRLVSTHTNTIPCCSHSGFRLFAKETTEYDLLADVQKSFEPFCDLWKRVDDWMTWHKGWMNDSFLSLDAEEVCTNTLEQDLEGKSGWMVCLGRDCMMLDGWKVCIISCITQAEWLCSTQVEKNVTVVSKALIKAGRFFEANGLEGCSKIASSVREQVCMWTTCTRTQMILMCSPKIYPILCHAAPALLHFKYLELEREVALLHLTTWQLEGGRSVFFTCLHRPASLTALAHGKHSRWTNSCPSCL